MAVITDLISYWALDEASGDATDAHGSNTLTDGNTVGTGTGIQAGARDFERDNSESLSRASTASLAFGDEAFSIAAWVKLESKAGFMALVAKAAPGEYELGYNSSTDRFTFTVNDGSGWPTISVAADTLGAPSLGVWYFLIARHDPTANTLSIQVNDGAVDSTAHSTGVLDSTANFALGAWDTSSYLDGLLDEVGLWGKVLTSGEATWLYNAGAGRTYADIVAEAGSLSSSADINGRMLVYLQDIYASLDLLMPLLKEYLADEVDAGGYTARMKQLIADATNATTP